MDFLKNKLLTIVLVLCLAFTILVGVTASRKGNIGKIQQAVSTVVAPIQKTVYAAGQRVSNIFYFISSIATTRKENMEFKKSIEELNQRLVDYDRYKRENDELNKLLQFKNTHANLTMKGGNVIGKVGENWFDILVIDIGENDGVKKGQYVINSSGLVGKILETTADTSKVVTVLDTKANIPSRISSTGDTGMVSGVDYQSSNEECEMTLLPVDTKAKKGDAVVTSNVISDPDAVVPADILIGYIERVEEAEPKLVSTAYLKPVVDFSRIEKVLVITK